MIVKGWYNEGKRPYAELSFHEITCILQSVMNGTIVTGLTFCGFVHLDQCQRSRLSTDIWVDNHMTERNGQRHDQGENWNAMNANSDI